MGETVFVFDDDCGFCTWWAEFFEDRAGVRIVGFTELDPDLRGRLPDGYTTCSHVVTDDRVYSCGASIEEALLRSGPESIVRPVVERLRRIGPYRAVREWVYRRGSTNRALWGKLLSKTPPVRRGDGGSDGE